MLTIKEHIDNLVRHIELVRESTLLLGERLINEGRKDFGRLLISKGFIHDASKFHGIEWKYLHAGSDVTNDKLALAVQQHVHTNPHHPEYWGGIENMPEIYVAEMVCDWYARAMEFGTGLREWINEEAIEKFEIDLKGEQYDWIVKYTDILLQNSFVKKKRANTRKTTKTK